MLEVANFKELARVNTGRHMLDSGGATGRHWQQPAIADDTPLKTASIWDGELDYISVNTAIHLDDSLTINQQETKRFHDWASTVDPDNNKSWPELLDEYTKEVRFGNLLEDTDYVINGDNTYNSETSFNQVFQWWTIGNEYGDDIELVIIQMHNGADVRGGYTAPVLADMNCDNTYDFTSTYMLEQAYCQECGLDAEQVNGYGFDDWSISIKAEQVAIICPENHEAETIPVSNS